MASYDKYFSGQLEDYDYPEAAVAASGTSAQGRLIPAGKPAQFRNIHRVAFDDGYPEHGGSFSRNPS